MNKITPFLWFENQAYEAAMYYISIFKGSLNKQTSHLEGTPSGSVDIFTIKLMGQEFTLMNAGPFSKFNESISFVINCDTQKEVDYYWEHLSSDKKAEQCGWLKDKFGVSWQVVPTALTKLLADPDKIRTMRVMKKMLTMKKIIISDLQKAYENDND